MKTKILFLSFISFSTAMFAQSAAGLWELDGNAGTSPGTHFVGTIDNQPLELKVNNSRALRIEPNANGAPNMIGGAPVNGVGSGVVGVVIGGGGAVNYEGSSQAHLIDSDFSTISGGRHHTIETGSPYSTIGGGRDNQIQANSYYSAIGGGWDNIIETVAYSSTIGGGRGNAIRANAIDATIGGGVFNSIQNDAPYSTIAGGWANTVQPNSSECAIGGGRGNTVRGFSQKSTIAGGNANTIETDAPYSTIGGGANNTIRSRAALSAIGGGFANRTAGQYGTIPGGINNFAGGHYSFAAGRRAKANHRGAFVWGDSTDADIASTAANQFVVRASGGVRLLSNTTGTIGVSLSANGASWGSISDRNAKKNFQSVDGEEVLERLAAIPVQKWNYEWESDDEVPHIGPMAQDFKGVFFEGRDNKTITTMEFDGVELAAIQGLNQKLEAEIKQKDDAIQELRHDLLALRAAVEELKQQSDNSKGMSCNPVRPAAPLPWTHPGCTTNGWLTAASRSGHAEINQLTPKTFTAPKAPEDWRTPKHGGD